MTEKYKLNAVLQDDLAKILESKGLLKEVRGGKIKCVNCETVIQISNISTIHVVDGKLQFHCNSDQCQNIKLNE